MQITIEISLYPLYVDYSDRVISFIQELNAQDGIEVLTNHMSTYISGNYDEVMDVVPKALKKCFTDNQNAAVIMKILPKKMDMAAGYLNF